MKHYNKNDLSELEAMEELENDLDDSFLFPHDFNQQMIYRGESRGDLLKKLSHILEFTGLIVALKGPAGAGKSTLLKQRFILEPKPGWKICLIDANAHPGINQISRIFSSQLNTPALNIANQSSITSFVEHLDNLRESALTTIIIIDNADKLNDDAAEFLIQLAQHEEDIQPLVRLVLSYKNIPQNIARLLPKQDNYEFIKTLEVKPLAFGETEDLIYQALDKIGIDDQGPFSNKKIQQIHNQSQGNIPIIQRLAEQEWQKHNQKISVKNTRQRNTERKRMLPKIAYTLAAGLAVTFILFYNLESSPEKDLMTAELSIPPAANSDDTTQKAVHRSSLIIRPENEVKAEESVTEKPIEKTAKTPDTVALKANEEQKQKTVKEPIQMAEKPKLDQKPLSVSKTEFKQNSWLLEQNINSFTLQLVGSGNEQAIKAFIRKHKLNEQAAYYKTVKNGKPWFAVVHGVYKNNAQALKASKAVARKTSTKPWIRPMNSIHQDLGISAFASQ